MAEFRLAYQRTLGHEGGYANDPKDRGGETYKGIAREYHHHWEGWQIIDKLKDDKDFPDCLDNHTSLQKAVEKFYKEQYWDKLKLDDNVDQELANELFDTAVNQGLGTAIKYFQEALNLLNRDEKDYEDMPVDGVMGPKTLTGYWKLLGTGEWSTRSEKQINKTLVKLLNCLQAEKYINICRNDSSQERFMFGWLNRV